MINYPIDYVREQFPAMCKTVNGHAAAFFDGPGGTQVPRRVVDKITDYIYNTNSNAHGVFKTSVESDALLWNARETFADFFNCSPDEVVFGENTTSINFKLSYALLRNLKPGDEILVTDIDHEGNRSPWRTLEDFGMIIKSVKINTDTITIDADDFKSKLSDKTKLFAVNWAANSCGTVSDIKPLIAEAHKVGALTIVDAVHYAPHKLIDVKDIGMDFLVCSAYKFFGPHLGVLYCKKSVGDNLKSVRVMSDDNTEMPYKIETGTPAFEIISGAAEAVEFIADIGAKVGDGASSGAGAGGSGSCGVAGAGGADGSGSCGVAGAGGADGSGGNGKTRRENIIVGMNAIDEYEESLASQLRSEIGKLPGVKIYGPGEGHPRTSTVSFTMEGHNSNDIAKYLAELGIFVWDGDYYAIETIMNVLKLGPVGGMLRIGLAPYTTQDEIDRLIAAMKAYK